MFPFLTRITQFGSFSAHTTPAVSVASTGPSGSLLVSGIMCQGPFRPYCPLLLHVTRGTDDSFCCYHQQSSVNDGSSKRRDNNLCHSLRSDAWLRLPLRYPGRSPCWEFLAALAPGTAELFRPAARCFLEDTTRTVTAMTPKPPAAQRFSSQSPLAFLRQGPVHPRWPQTGASPTSASRVLMAASHHKARDPQVLMHLNITQEITGKAEFCKLALNQSL